MDKQLKVISKWKHLSLYCVVTVALLLTGCEPVGGTVYEVIYPSGFTRSYNFWNEKTPIEGTSYYLQSMKAEDFEKTRSYDLQILDGEGIILYEYPGIGHEVLRGILQKDNVIWVCAEFWTTGRYIGYFEGWLKESNLLLIDLSDGKILFQDKVGENEFFITSNETRCYFYAPGKEEDERLLGLIKIPSKNAEIFYRDTSDWAEKHTIYSFDYVAEPNIDTSNGVETRLKFYISEEQVKVAWTSYESIGNGNWEYLEKKIYEIPLDGNNSK